MQFNYIVNELSLRSYINLWHIGEVELEKYGTHQIWKADLIEPSPIIMLVCEVCSMQPGRVKVILGVSRLDKEAALVILTSS